MHHEVGGDPPRTDRTGGMLSEGPWRVLAVAPVALLVGIVVAGGVALALTLAMGQVADRMLRVDAAFQDEAEDLHVAILDLRHAYRNLALIGPTPTGLQEHAAAVAALHEELGELAEVEDVPQELIDPEALSRAVDAYDSALLDSVPAYETDPDAFQDALDIGLRQIASWERSARSLDEMGTAHASDALHRLGTFTSTAALAMVTVLVAVVGTGVALTLLAMRVLRELRRLTAAERESAAGVRELLQTRTDFLADASHELRTPLTVLRGTAELALRTGPAGCSHVPALLEISGESVRMGRLVEELLFIARHDAGGSTMEVAEIELEAMLADVAARGEAIARERGIELETGIDVRGHARLDEEQVGRAVLALIDNATRHSPPGGTVRLDAGVVADGFWIAVLDRGAGIAPDVLPVIFERFRRGSRTKGGHGGAGLGLAIARAIVEAHGGTIAAEPRPGGGMAMTVRLPLGLEGPADARIQGSPEASAKR